MKRLLRYSVLALLLVAAWIGWRQLPPPSRAAWWPAVREEARHSVQALETRKSGTQAGAQDDDEGVMPSRVEKVDGLNGVRLSPEAQAHTGLRVEALAAHQYRAESLATGKVLDAGPLLELRVAYNDALREVAAGEAAIAVSARAVERLRVLHREDANVSARQLQEAEAQIAAERARLGGAQARVQAVRNRAAQQWGPELADRVLLGEEALAEQLISREQVLLLLTLRAGEHLGSDADVVLVGPTGDRANARNAFRVGPAAQTDTQGETWIFRTAGEGLRIAMRLDAWIPQTGVPDAGVEVPATAVIWHANRPWVYVQVEGDLFVRRPLANHAETRAGWFVHDGFAPGDKVVVSGAQMLFSEEFRANIPSEDEARE